jgi:protocatechuate 3,4-dioxygenase alpha subunit
MSTHPGTDPLAVPPDPAGPFQPRSGQRGSGFLTGPLRLGTTPSATVGPYLAIGLTWADGIFAAAQGTPGGIWIRGRVVDGAGEVVPDAMVETWQADPNGGFASPQDPRGAAAYPGFRGYARAQTLSGEFAVFTLKPGRVPDGEGGWQAPHIDVSVFARGLLDRVVTRIYFADETDANAADAVLRALPADRRQTLLATPTGEGYRFDVHLQGEHETVFFTV